MPVERIRFSPNQIYHIYNHAIGKELLFQENENYNFFLMKYDEHTTGMVETIAYCLKSNHFHLMIRTKCYEDVLEIYKSQKAINELEEIGGYSQVISKKFSNLFNSYTQSFNKVYSRKGGLFHHRFQRKEIDMEEYYTRLIAYIHNNPVYHGFIKHPGLWKHSSYNSFLSTKQTKLCRDEVIEWFGSIQNFIKFHEGLLTAEDINQNLFAF